MSEENDNSKFNWYEKEEIEQVKKEIRDFTDNLISMSPDKRQSEMKVIRKELSKVFRFDKIPESCIQGFKFYYDANHEFDDMIYYIGLIIENTKPDNEIKFDFRKKAWNKRNELDSQYLSHTEAMQRLNYHLSGIETLIENKSVKHMLEFIAKKHMKKRFVGMRRQANAESEAIELIHKLDNISTINSILFNSLTEDKGWQRSNVTLRDVIKEIARFWTSILGRKYTIVGDKHNPESFTLCYIYCVICYIYPLAEEDFLISITRQAEELRSEFIS